MFDASKEWRCEQCRVRNPNEVLKCRACEALKPGVTEEELKNAGIEKPGEKTNGAAAAAFAAFKSSAPSTGFAFGSTSASSSGFSFQPAAATGEASTGSTGFAFVPSTASTDAPATGGFAFAPSTSGFTFGETKSEKDQEKTEKDQEKTETEQEKDKEAKEEKTEEKTSRKRKTTDSTATKPAKATRGTKGSTKSVATVSGKGKGLAFTFGSGDMSQLGLGLDIRERRFPALVKKLEKEDIIQVAAGALHNLALTADGCVFSWGCNDDGAIGRTTADDVAEFTPELVEGLDGVKIIQVACGASHSIAVSEDGHVYSWGAYRDVSGLVGFDKQQKVVRHAIKVEGFPAKDKVVKIAAGESHSLALTASGKVYYWGDVYIGRRSSERFKRDRLTPFIVPITTRIDRTRRTIAKTKEDIKITNVFAGGYTSFAVSESGLLWVWGPNNYTQCGIPRLDQEDQAITQPTVVAYFADKGIKIKAAASASQFSIVLAEDGRVFAFGRVADGRLGQGKDYKYKDKDEQVEPLELTTLTPEYLSSEASWNQESDTFAQEKHPLVTTQSDDCVVSISCGETHSFAVTAKGRLMAWGNGELLQLGNGTERVEYEPYWVRSHAITTVPRYVIQAAGGSQHSILLAKNAE